MHDQGLLYGVLFVLSTTYIPQKRVPFILLFAISLIFSFFIMINKGAKLEFMKMVLLGFVPQPNLQC